MAITITVNGQSRSLDLEPDTPLLWAIRETLGLTGTKFGCGISACGACTVHLNGRAVRSCTLHTPRSRSRTWFRSGRVFRGLPTTAAYPARGRATATGR